MSQPRKKVQITLPNGKKGGSYTVGNFIRLKDENFFRRVNSDGTLTKVGLNEKEYSLTKAPRRVKNYTTQQIYRNYVDNIFSGDYEILPEDLREGYLNRQQQLIGREAEFIIPVYGNNEITFNKGMPSRLRFSKIEPQVLDSIVTNAGRYDYRNPNKPIGVRNAIGIALNESVAASKSSNRRNRFRTSPSFNDSTRWLSHDLYEDDSYYNYISPITMNSAWVSQDKNTINSYADAALIYRDIYLGKGEEAANQWWNKSKPYYDHLRRKEQDVSSWNPYFPVYELFLKQKNGRSLANYRETGYKEKIYDYGNALMSTEEGRNWWNTSGRDLYYRAANGEY